jgi:hypothetical protein
LIGKYQTVPAGQVGPRLSWPSQTRIYILSLSSWRTKANKAGVLLGIFITLHNHPECGAMGWTELCTIYTQTIAYLGLVDQKNVFFIGLFAFMRRQGNFNPNL